MASANLTLALYPFISDSDIFGDNLGLDEITSASQSGHMAPRLTRRRHLATCCFQMIQVQNPTNPLPVKERVAGTLSTHPIRAPLFVAAAALCFFTAAISISPVICVFCLLHQILGRFNRARAAQLTLPHFVCQTPLFMPVGTQVPGCKCCIVTVAEAFQNIVNVCNGPLRYPLRPLRNTETAVTRVNFLHTAEAGVTGTIKGLTTSQLEEIGCQIILGNTYHLALRPTSELIDELGGLHKFMNWPRALLTDSGGFQMVSLLHLADITEKGVTFQSPVDGKPMLLTPEESIQIQNRIGADIIMALDDVVRTTITGPRIEEAMYRTLRWIDRCIEAHKRPNEQNLFGIVQGGLDPVLRDICVRGLVDRNLPGYAIGGLSGGEDKDSFWRVVAQCTASLPEDKPRYVMGVGYPLDIVVCSALGADMYDCVYPTRTARFGTALIPEGVLKLKHRAMADDTRPIDPTCMCMVCKNYTRAYIHCLVTKDAMGSQLLSYHNLYYMMKLSNDLHSSIIEGQFPDGELYAYMYPLQSISEVIFIWLTLHFPLPAGLYVASYRKCSQRVMFPSGSAMPWRSLESISLPAVLNSQHPNIE
ncbi:hypothetical protein HYC85_008185 [Camellia sinensis]|uniref:Queuine tRNA-ribosyltransferase catalytic subunit 1 n=1 Tax=Camellia sinensis TaxID=4442 RepID=A0A7J7HRT6_CAMSI|nr:hypothetical protein HYC85_008185 [Camellia sinensis]